MRAADAPAWIGAILLIGGIVVTAVISPPIGAGVALIGAAILWVVRRREGENEGDQDAGGTGRGAAPG